MRQVFGNKPLKSYRFWIVIGFFSYTLCGFLLLPYVLKTQLIKYVEGTLHQQASLEVASFNPFLLRLGLQNLRITTPDQAPLLKLDELIVDFDTFGLFKGAWQFSTVSLTGAEVFAEIDSAGNLNLNNLVPPPSTNIESSRDEDKPATLPRLILKNIAINQARVYFKQLNRAEAFSIDLNPLNFNIANFSTLPEDDGRFSFDAKLSDRETLEFTGTLLLEPLALNGHFALNNIELGRGGDYLKELLLFSINEGTLSISSDFLLDNSGPAQSLALQVTNIDIALQQLQLGTLAPVEPLLSLNSITLNKGRLAWPEQDVHIESLVVESGSVNSWLTADKVFNYTQLVKAPDSQASTNSAPSKSQAGSSTEEPKPWQLHLDQVQLKELQLSFDDRSLSEPSHQTVEIIDLSLSPFSLKQGQEFDLQAQLKINKTGKTTINGKVGAMPAMAALVVSLREVPLPPLNNYLHEFIQLDLTKGSVDADLQLNYNKSLALSGDIDIKQLDTFDLADQESWINWQNLSIDALDLKLEPASLNIASVELVQPYFDAVVFDNGETRLHRMLVLATKQSADEGVSSNDTEAEATSGNVSGSEEGGFPVTIDKFKLVDGSMDYKDFNLPLNFSTHIHSLHGQAVDITTSSSKRTELILDGKIDQHGKAKISAVSQLSSPQAFSKVKLDLENVDITSASSYSGKFAGYAIDAGTLSLNLDYHIEQGKMIGDNHLLLESLTLGDTVDSPDAVSLPLKLAVALMKDINGNIDIDLPVEGDLNNPEVRVGALIWKAFGNMLIKIVASPFKLLGGLFASGEDSGLENILFVPGSSQLSTAEQQGLNKLVEALQKKPALALSISACYQPESDSQALQSLQFNQAYKALSEEPSEGLLGEPISYQSSVLETMYSKAFGDEKLALLKTETEQALAPQSENQQDSETLASQVNSRISEQMLQQLVSEQTLTSDQLITLANQRSKAVFNYLVNDDNSELALNPSRIQTKENVHKLESDVAEIACPLTLMAL
jgi:Domain of Unknown Function (DUF748)